ncbi:TetR/AcrR family transcriptional regulator [Vibrio mangrovi]|uniref:HTH-type transcriptional regulator LuxR n=1 Tax=Vibrio mangrovi TaxID=474394 RepID=A0A1Y6IQP5_9VIBR|nr:TetR/AcrR family transcriptional regulator [Vibrio mangrovi]MDW6004082.1 TetR/AcrR family transcriptional regulator [Vibrio mangrovi]SMR99120.1 HTH-type transcriptional regulator LuxR [Vibrio mangrovi]
MNKKKLQIVEAAIRLFARDGVGVTTAAIAKEASVSNGTLFNHFETKQALLDDVYLFIKRNMAAEILDGVDFSASVREIFLAQWLSFANWSYDHLTEYQALNVLHSSQLLGERARQCGEDLWEPIFEKLAEGQESGTLNAISPELLCITAQSYLHAVVVHINRKNYSRSEAEVIFREAFTIYWRGIASSASNSGETD